MNKLYKEKTIEKIGVVSELNGKYWGLIQDNCYGWVELEGAKVSDPRYCHEPKDMTYSDDHRNIIELDKSDRKYIKVTTKYEVYE